MFLLKVVIRFAENAHLHPSNSLIYLFSELETAMRVGNSFINDCGTWAHTKENHYDPGGEW